MDNFVMEATIRQAESAAVEAIGSILRVVQHTLTAGYEEDTEHLDEIELRLSKEIDALQKSHEDLAPILEAQAQLLEQEALHLLAGGDREGSAAKTEEAQALRGKGAAILEKINENSEIIAGNSSERHQRAVMLFQESWPVICHVTLSLQKALVDLLDGCWNAAQDFNGRHYSYWTPQGQERIHSLLGAQHQSQLVANELSDRELSRRMDSWFR